MSGRGAIVEATEAALEAAVRVLRRGGLVAFPTETVYGLGASVRDPEAVRRIFAAKGRPADHPLIVHMARATWLPRFAVEVPEAAWRLAEVLWPGPLALVLRRRADVPAVVTAGLPTIALRVPRHPVALALLERFGDGIAAPSANRFGRTSPTRAEHVRDDLGDRVDLILDGGDCAVGLESTIVDLSRGGAVVLRPGAIGQAEIEAIASGAGVPAAAPPPRVPGQLASHYAPRAAVRLAADGQQAARRAREALAAGRRVVLLADAPVAGVQGDALRWLHLPADPVRAAPLLYARLREADRWGADEIVVVPPREEGIGVAIRDRLLRAAAPRPRRDA